MTHPAHLSQPMPTDALSRCGYGWAHGHAGCTEPAATHFRIVQPNFTGVTNACVAHTDETRSALPVAGEHPFRRSCAESPVTWNRTGSTSWCSR